MKGEKTRRFRVSFIVVDEPDKEWAQPDASYTIERIKDHVDSSSEEYGYTVVDIQVQQVE